MVPVITTRGRPRDVAPGQQGLAHALQFTAPSAFLSSQGSECISPAHPGQTRGGTKFSLMATLACPHRLATLSHVLRGLSDQALWKLINVTMAGVLLRLALRQEHVVVPWRCLLRVL